MKYLKYIVPVVLTLFIGTAAFASTIPQAPTLFETYLANSQGSSDTTLTIASPALRDGSNLSGYTCLTIDANTPSLEYECGTLSGTTFTVSIRGIDAVTGFTNIPSLQFAHHRGADVKVTDYPVLTQLTNIFFGTDTIPAPIQYAPSLATTTIAANGNNIVNVNLLDSTAFNGAGVINATTAARGVSQVGTALQTASSTLTGSSGATLLIPTSEATSTYNAQTAPLKVVVSQNNGKIDNNFLATSTFAYTLGLATTSNVQVFTSTTTPGTWIEPLGARMIQVILIGGGQGGQGGQSNGAGGAGEPGGGSGQYNSFYFPASLVPSTVTVTVGAGSVGGISSGGLASSGGNTLFGGLASALGGSAKTATPGTAAGSTGGAGGTSTGNSGSASPLNLGVLGGAGALVNAAGSNGQSATTTFPIVGGTGGGGGAISGGAGTNGGNGGLYGAGGGGGGGASSGAGGTGGQGADGIAEIITYF